MFNVHIQTTMDAIDAEYVKHPDQAAWYKKMAMDQILEREEAVPDTDNVVTFGEPDTATTATPKPGRFADPASMVF